MKKHGRMIKTASAIAVCVAVVCCVLYAIPQKTYTSETFAMGSLVKIVMIGKEDKSAPGAVGGLEREISNKIPDSEISYLNNNGKASLHTYTRMLIETALDVCKNSGGALDITLGNLSDLWDFDAEEPSLPDDDDIQNALSSVGYEKVSVDEHTVTIADGVKIDLGAIGKGAACDSVISSLKYAGVPSAIISVGGSVACYGKNEHRKNFTVGIRNPFSDENSVFATLKMGEELSFISTSGNYEKYFEYGGKRYHHILSRESGYPVDSGLIGVTVVCDSGVLSDALSTACFALGYEKSLPLLSHYNAGAVFVTDKNEVFVTDGLKDAFTLNADGFTYEK